MREPIKRIKNLALNHYDYLGKEPDYPGIRIDLYYKNEDYNKQDEYITEDGIWFTKEGYLFKKHISCFEKEEEHYTLAIFEYDENEPCWELKYL